MKFKFHIALVYLTLLLWLLPSAIIFSNSLLPPEIATSVTDQLLTITDSGYIKQNQTTIGMLTVSGGTATASIRVPAVSSYLYELHIALPQATKLPSDAVHFDSIQGTQGMTWFQPDPASSLYLDFPQLLPEAHTSVTISIPTSALHSSPAVQLSSYLQGNVIQLLVTLLTLPVVCLLALVFSVALPKKKDRTERESPPNDLTASEFGIILHGGLQRFDLSALFLSMAERGAFDIVVHLKEIYLLRHDSSLAVAPEEASLLSVLFADGARVAYLKERIRSIRQLIFSNSVGSLSTAAYGKLIASDYFLESPQKTHLRIKTIGIILQLLGSFSAIFIFLHGQSPLMLLFFLLSLLQYESGLILYAISSHAMLLSETGNQVRQGAMEFANFLTRSELVNESNSSHLFYHMLPYAVALGVASHWASLFIKRSQTIPAWLTAEDVEYADGAEFTTQAVQIAKLLASTLDGLKDPNVG